MPGVRISALNIHPVKSCAAIPLEVARVLPTGLESDRRWMIVDARGRYQTQRELPRLALIRPRLAGDGLIATAPDMPELTVGAGMTERVPVRIWDDQCTGIDAGEPAARWVSDFIGRPLRLVSFAMDTRRPVAPRWTDGLEAAALFSDAFPFLVLSEGSLEDLNSRLPQPLPMNRFRPNIVLSGLAPYQEDHIREFTAGEVRIRLVKPCARCAIPGVDQGTGERQGDEPLRTLKSYRWDSTLRGATFGQNGILVSGANGRIQVSQAVEIEVAGA